MHTSQLTPAGQIQDTHRPPTLSFLSQTHYEQRMRMRIRPLRCLPAGRRKDPLASPSPAACCSGEDHHLSCLRALEVSGAPTTSSCWTRHRIRASADERRRGRPASAGWACREPPGVNQVRHAPDFDDRSPSLPQYQLVFHCSPSA
jgi:hypothetical protein